MDKKDTCSWIHRKDKSMTDNIKDFYQTIPQMSFCLLDVCKCNFTADATVLDCCFGEGAISNVLKTFFNKVDEIDLFDEDNPINFLTYFPKEMKEKVLANSDYYLRYFKKAERDDIMLDPTNNLCFYDGPIYDLIVANSPFTSKYKFIDHATDIGTTFISLIPGLCDNYNITGKYKMQKNYAGRISMYPKVMLSEELSENGSFVQGGTQNYSWDIFSKTHEEQHKLPVEIVIDLHNYDKIVQAYLTNS